MIKMFGTVVGIDTNGNEKVYRALISSLEQIGDRQYKWKIQTKLFAESELIKSILKGAEWSNVAVSNGKVIGSSGDLKRFKSANKPYVILSQIVNSSGRIIGYKIARYDGIVKNIPVKQLIGYGARITKQNQVPIQNAMYVSEQNEAAAHFRAYPGKQFIEELYITKKSADTDKRRVNTAKNEKNLHKLEDIYTTEQIKQLKAGKKNGVDIRIYANPALSAQQMEMLRKGLEKKVNVKPFAFPEYTVDAMKYYTLELMTGMDIRQYLHPKYSIAKIAELSIAADEGLDMSKLTDPELSVRQVQERRIRLENGVFHDEDVNMEGSWI